MHMPMQSDAFIYIIIVRISKWWIFIIQRSMKMQQLEIMEGLESEGYLELEGIIGCSITYITLDTSTSIDGMTTLLKSKMTANLVRGGMLKWSNPTTRHSAFAFPTRPAFGIRHGDRPGIWHSELCRAWKLGAGSWCCAMQHQHLSVAFAGLHGTCGLCLSLCSYQQLC